MADRYVSSALRWQAVEPSPAPISVEGPCRCVKLKADWYEPHNFVKIRLLYVFSNETLVPGVSQVECPDKVADHTAIRSVVIAAAAGSRTLDEVCGLTLGISVAVFRRIVSDLWFRTLVRILPPSPCGGVVLI